MKQQFSFILSAESEQNKEPAKIKGGIECNITGGGICFVMYLEDNKSVKCYVSCGGTCDYTCEGYHTCEP